MDLLIRSGKFEVVALGRVDNRRRIGQSGFLFDLSLWAYILLVVMLYQTCGISSQCIHITHRNICVRMNEGSKI